MPVVSIFSTVRCHLGEYKLESLAGKERKVVHRDLSIEEGRGGKEKRRHVIEEMFCLVC